MSIDGGEHRMESILQEYKQVHGNAYHVFTYLQRERTSMGKSSTWPSLTTSDKTLIL